ncbi:hypothetical protein PMAC_002309 [Pneumocystis sp. 'macacae']|nr:hypothetical protein PMAC_002309 [Pneumocystis sp. 'macacae']
MRKAELDEHWTMSSSMRMIFLTREIDRTEVPVAACGASAMAACPQRGPRGHGGTREQQGGGGGRRAKWLSDIKLGRCAGAWYLSEEFCCWEAEGCGEWRRWVGSRVGDAGAYVVFAVGPAAAVHGDAEETGSFLAGECVSGADIRTTGSGVGDCRDQVYCGGVCDEGLSGDRDAGDQVGWAVAGDRVGAECGEGGPVCACVGVYWGGGEAGAGGAAEGGAAGGGDILCVCGSGGGSGVWEPDWRGVVLAGDGVGVWGEEDVEGLFLCTGGDGGAVGGWDEERAGLTGQSMNPFRTGQLVMFQVHYRRSWHFFELIFFGVLGVFGGVYGALVIRWNVRVQGLRERYFPERGVCEAVFFGVVTAVVSYGNAFLRIDTTESMKILFRECGDGAGYGGICREGFEGRMVVSLVVATVVRTCLIIVSYGLRVPAGIFVPSMAVGATFGRLLGMIVSALQERFPGFVLFSACEPNVSCITPGTYAFLGAAAALSGIMHITVSVVVIMFELTGALTFILPTMVGRERLPYLDSKEHYFGVPVEDIMTLNLTVIRSDGMNLHELETMLSASDIKGFPVVADRESMLLVGFVKRSHLQWVLEQFKSRNKLSPTTLCFFSLPENKSESSSLLRDSCDGLDDDAGFVARLDFSHCVDVAPLTVHPQLPLEVVMELFQKLGPKVILVEQYGQLCGLLTIKDLLKYKFKVEYVENLHDLSSIENDEKQIWEILVKFRTWIKNLILIYSGKHIRASEIELDLYHS